MFAWMRKRYGNPDGVSFWLGLHFLRSAQFLAELVHPNERNQLQPSTPPHNCVDHPANIPFQLSC